MGNQIITQPQTFKTDTVVMGSAAGLSAVSGLTVYGNISASGTIYGTGAAPVKTSYTFNGSVSSFPINGYTNTTPENYAVYLDGVFQEPGDAYTLSGANIVMSQVPGNGVVADVIAYQLMRVANLVAPNSTSFTFNGTTSSFAVNGYTDTNATNYLAYLDGVHQIPGTDYTVASNGTISFTPTPAAGVIANVIAFQSTISMLSLSGIEPLVSTYTGTGAQTAFVVGVSGGFTNTTAASYLVIIGGLVQRPGIDYTVSSASGGTINFTAAPPSGASIVVFAYQTMPSAQSAYSAANEIAASKIDKPSSASAGQVLSYNGTSWVAAASGSSITSGTAVTLTSQTSVDFTGIPSTAKRITVLLAGVSTSGTSPLLIQVGAGSVTTSGYLGTTAGGSTTFTSVQLSNGAQFIITTGQNTNVAHGHVVFEKINGSTWVFRGVAGYSNTIQTIFTNGSIALAGDLDRVRLTTINGTDSYDAGIVSIMWE